MGKFKKTKKILKLKRVINPNDSRIKQNKEKQVKNNNNNNSNSYKDGKKIKQVAPIDSNLFFNYNENLSPPYNIILDTNFINSSIQYKIDIIKGCSELLLAKCNIYVTDCVVAEMEKLGQRFSLALKLLKDPRYNRLTCTHKGTYADDCIVNRVTESRCYIIATNDKDLKIRLRKIPGVPILYAKNFKYRIERLPDNIMI
ncbi:rRNA-processing protein FCF1 [Plasmodium brasilianum]|uniref:rRNA-processing protein FCF1, putative n=3 Tax=Plasmodium (Plasmodium) TaxID=418103 RepID=A0A1D3JLT8_PLAMA|nr:rRNA-processing protein FCF1, putative [Plasmodium malariae]KAI4840105.1 rRNA-processing protein FCF1 [Plasmodium brasilianum]SBT87470.1 rRNA-processing protein FCF1, putative [Plasmodium malariae]